MLLNLTSAVAVRDLGAGVIFYDPVALAYGLTTTDVACQLMFKADTLQQQTAPEDRLVLRCEVFFDVAPSGIDAGDGTLPGRLILAQADRYVEVDEKRACNIATGAIVDSSDIPAAIRFNTWKLLHGSGGRELLSFSTRASADSKIYPHPIIGGVMRHPGIRY